MKIDQPTPGQLRVLVFVAAHIDTVGLPPRRDEIANHFGTKHRQQVHCQLYQLELRGLLVRATMQVTDKGRIAITEGSSVDRTEQRRIHQRERNRRRVAAEQSLRGFKNALREALQLDPLPEWDS